MPHNVKLKSYEYARNFWELLVKKVGEPEAKSIMRHAMCIKEPGRRRTDQDVALSCFIYAYILRSGLRQTDRAIATRLLKSRPHYLEYESGAVAVANSEVTETYMSLADDPIVRRTPIVMSLAAIKKRVERIRRSAINDNLLPKQYAPRAYYRE